MYVEVCTTRVFESKLRLSCSELASGKELEMHLVIPRRSLTEIKGEE